MYFCMLYRCHMRIAYLYDRHPREAEKMDCEVAYVDTKKTNRMELHFLLEKGGLASGDVVCVAKLSDLGRGQEAAKNRALIEKQGATVEVVEGIDAERLRGRPPDIVLDENTLEHLALLWVSPLPLSHVLQRASAIVGREMKRQWFYDNIGDRQGNPPKKRKKKGE